MHHVASYLSDYIPKPRGGRVSSPKLRAAYEFSECFEGLPADTKRYDLLLLVKKAGKAAGFSAKMIELLDYYVNFTREIDWRRGSRPIVYQSLTKTALDLCVSERQIQRLEKALFEKGAITFSDSGNHRRQGQRCTKTGEILFAFGVELTPLAALKPELEKLLAAKEENTKAFLTAKRQVSFYRRSICALLAEAEEGGYDSALSDQAARYQQIARPIRTYMKPEALKQLVAAHQTLHREFLDIAAEHSGTLMKQDANLATPAADYREMSRPETSEMSSTKILPTKNHSNKLNTGRPAASCSRERNGEEGDQQPNHRAAVRSESDSDQKITLKQVINAASADFRSYIPIEGRAANWSDIVDAAYRMRTELSIDQEIWRSACSEIGRNSAAICLLLTDRARARAREPVQNPAAYFRRMVQRGQCGQLNLHASIQGRLRECQTL